LSPRLLFPLSLSHALSFSNTQPGHRLESTAGQDTGSREPPGRARLKIAAGQDIRQDTHLRKLLARARLEDAAG
jgi:hypothetical protein